MNIAFFDFDGTITTNDSLFKFIRFCVGDIRFVIGFCVLLPTFLMYKLKFIPNYTAKQRMISYFFKGMQERDFKKKAYQYSLEKIDEIVRPQAIDRIQWHKDQGDKVVIVSASIDCWLRPWCMAKKLELIATKIELIDGNVSGNLLTKNCYGVEKVNRIAQVYDLSNYETIYAYGDSKGDFEMLALANIKEYKPFRV